MKDNKKISLCILILFVFSLYPVISTAQQFSAILVAHGSTNPDHNQKILNMKNRIANPSLSALEVAFLGNDSQGKMDTVLDQ